MRGSPVAVGIDLGATNLKVGLVDTDGNILRSLTVPTPHRLADDVATEIEKLVYRLCKEAGASFCGVGCGLPGVTDTARGVLIHAPNFSEWKNIPFQKLLEEKLQCRVVIDNDANMFAVSEIFLGAGKTHKNFILLLLGTGIGTALVLDGKVFRGEEGTAGEAAHMVIDVNGVPCGCGGRGCWGEYAGAHAFAHFNPRFRNMSPEQLACLDDAGDMDAHSAWETFGRYLGVGMISLMNVVGMQTFIIGGGIAASWDRFVPAARREIEARTYAHHRERLCLLPSSFGDMGGVVGAALSVLHHNGANPVSLSS